MMDMKHHYICSWFTSFISKSKHLLSVIISWERNWVSCMGEGMVGRLARGGLVRALKSLLVGTERFRSVAVGKVGHSISLYLWSQDYVNNESR